MPSSDEIKALAQTIQQKYTTSKAAQAAKEKNDDVFTHACLYLRDVLFFMEFESAVSHADAGRVLLVIKYRAYMFHGAGLTNYAWEALEILLIWEHELSGALRRNMEKSWFVNRSGLPGRWFAADLYLEQLNRLVKARPIPS